MIDVDAVLDLAVKVESDRELTKAQEDRKAVQLHEQWRVKLQEDFDMPYMQALRSFLVERKKAGRTIYPPGKHIFRSLNLTPIDTVQVVIIGQDPYHGVGQANGLCFSVTPPVSPPPSLINIIKELYRDIKGREPTSQEIQQNADLSRWAEQGVLLLNAILTVEANAAGSHASKGWEKFTDRVVSIINEHCENVVFLLWGAYAQKKCHMLDAKKHCVLKSVHPSPLSAHRGFLGCAHFSKANAYLQKVGREPIKWLVS